MNIEKAKEKIAELLIYEDVSCLEHISSDYNGKYSDSELNVNPDDIEADPDSMTFSFENGGLVIDSDTEGYPHNKTLILCGEGEFECDEEGNVTKITNIKITKETDISDD